MADTPSSALQPERPEFFSPRIMVFGIVVVIAVALLVISKARQNNSQDYPYGLPYIRYTPRWISGIIYSTNLLGLMDAAKKRHPNTPFRLVRLDTDITVLPDSTVNELAGLPNELASNILALQYDMVGRYTGLRMLQDVDLHLRVVQKRMMPNLAQLTAELEDEVTNAIDTLFPQIEGEWISFDLYSTMLQIAARVFSRSVVGSGFCRDKRWLDFSMNFTENVLNSLVLIRYFPPILQPLLQYLIPSVRASMWNIRQCEALLVPVFAELLRQDDKEKGEDQDNTARRPTAHGPLDWFTDVAHGAERDPVKLVHSQILLALGAIHTSLFAEMNMFHDLVANPVYIAEIRDEINAVAAKGWDGTSYGELYKLDSILRESQRMSPPFLTGLRRVMKQDYVFGDGSRVRKAQYVCVPTYSIQNNLTRDASTFDGLRSYKLREKEDSWKSSKHLFATTESSVLAFGHGRTACPGRWIASLTLKIIFTKIVSEFDFEASNRRTHRAPSKFAHEIVFPDAKAGIRLRRRPGASAPF